MSIVDSFKQAEQQLESYVNDVDVFYHSLTGQDDWSFTDEFRRKVKEIIRKYGVAEVLTSAQEVVDKYGDEGIHKLIAFTICRNNPKTKTNYVCGILKNKLKCRWLPNDTIAAVKSMVSDIVDLHGGETLDKVIEDLKYGNYESVSDWMDTVDSRWLSDSDYAVCRLMRRIECGCFFPIR